MCRSIHIKEKLNKVALINIMHKNMQCMKLCKKKSSKKTSIALNLWLTVQFSIILKHKWIVNCPPPFKHSTFFKLIAIHQITYSSCIMQSELKCTIL